MATPPQVPAKQPSKGSNVSRMGRRFEGAGKRAFQPAPFMHLHPANAKSVENLGRMPRGPLMG